MKKLLLILLISIAFGCSKDEEECEQTVHGFITESETQGEVSTTTYYVHYGESEETEASVEVNKEAYDYYRRLGENSDDPVCWEGTDVN